MAKPKCMSRLIVTSSFFMMMMIALLSIDGVDARKQLAPEDESSIGLQHGRYQGSEKVGKIDLYVHNVVSGSDQTVYEVAKSSITATSGTSFGEVSVVDNKMTLSADPSSLEIGRLQGLTTFADLETPALSVNLNFYFTAGRSKGSSVWISGRSEIKTKEAEYPVVGGTGIYRFARGYATSTTITDAVGTEQGSTVVKYTLHVTYNMDNAPINLSRV